MQPSSKRCPTLSTSSWEGYWLEKIPAPLNDPLIATASPTLAEFKIGHPGHIESSSFDNTLDGRSPSALKTRTNTSSEGAAFRPFSN